MAGADPDNHGAAAPAAEPPPAVLGRYTQKHHEDFMAQGFLQLGPLLAPAELEAMSRRLDEVMLGEVTYEGVTFQLDPGGA